MHMKKYFLHDGKEQSGPFDVEELKAKQITPDTSIWYEGIEDWTTAGKIEELKGLFKTSTPPPMTKKNDEPKPSQPKKKSRLGLIITIVVVVVLLGFGAVMVINNPNSVPGVKVEINTPKPVIVTKRADNKKSGLLNARTTIYATVLNQGGNGNVLVTFHVFQGNKSYDMSKEIYLLAGKSKDLEVTFEEVDYLSGKITYSVDAKAH